MSSHKNGNYHAKEPLFSQSAYRALKQFPEYRNHVLMHGEIQYIYGRTHEAKKIPLPPRGLRVEKFNVNIPSGKLDHCSTGIGRKDIQARSP